MRIKILRSSYLKSDNLYNDFVKNEVDKPEHYTNDYIELENVPYFPVYLARASFKEYEKAYFVIRDSYINIDRDYILDGDFWYSILLVHFRDQIIKAYPEILKDKTKFNNVIMKQFNWENYIYKLILTAQFLNDYVEEGSRNYYYQVIYNNLDVYNYILKYPIFRSGEFIAKILSIIDDNELSKILKARIIDRPDLGKDERYGRRVIFEFNKDYPVIFSPMYDTKELKLKFMEYLSYYYDEGTEINESDDDLTF